MGKLFCNIFYNDAASYVQIRYQCVNTTDINAYIDINQGFPSVLLSIYGIE